MLAGMVCEHRKHLIAQFLIEAWCLEIIGVEDDLMATTDTGLVFRRLQQFGAISLSS